VLRLDPERTRTEQTVCGEKLWIVFSTPVLWKSLPDQGLEGFLPFLGGNKKGESMRIIESIAEMQQATEGWRCEGKKIALVPTMGYLHEGHLELIRAIRSHGDVLVTSILSTRPNSDLARILSDTLETWSETRAWRLKPGPTSLSSLT
jgi:hypothetical protein